MKIDIGKGFQIETPGLQLICCNKEILETIFKGDVALATLLQINIPVKWTASCGPAFKFTYQKILTGSGKN